MPLEIHSTNSNMICLVATIKHEMPLAAPESFCAANPERRKRNTVSYIRRGANPKHGSRSRDFQKEKIYEIELVNGIDQNISIYYKIKSRAQMLL